LKAPSFAYAKAKSLAEAFELLERPGAKILAGGQSLIPSLNMRLASPELLVDITGLKDLTGIDLRPGGLRIGALVTHAQLEKSDKVAQHAPLLAQAVAHIAHPAIRNRGTLGGSLALADPAAEYPACALALNATIVLAHRRGERRVSASHFFKALFETDIRPGEIVAAVEFPGVERSVFLELARRQGDYAIVGLAGVAGPIEGVSVVSDHLALPHIRDLDVHVGVLDLLASFAAGMANPFRRLAATCRCGKY